MNTILTIFYVAAMLVSVAMMLVLGLFILRIFIQTSKELWDDMKSDVIRWFKTTMVGMNYYNRKNSVEVLSEVEYRNIPKSGKVIYINKED